MTGSTLPPEIFDQVVDLVDYIPIVNFRITSGSIDARQVDQSTTDKLLPLLGLQGTSINFRDIMQVLTSLMKQTRSISIINDLRRNRLRDIGCTYPIEYLLFDYCLAL
jgi:hypothetical protein